MRQSVQRRLQQLEEISGFRHSAENPRDRIRTVVGGWGWTPIPGRPGSFSMARLDLNKSTCRRTLHSNGLLWEWVDFFGDWDELEDGELERWIAAQPVKRFEIRRQREHRGL